MTSSVTHCNNRFPCWRKSEIICCIRCLFSPRSVFRGHLKFSKWPAVSGRKLQQYHIEIETFVFNSCDSKYSINQTSIVYFTKFTYQSNKKHRKRKGKDTILPKIRTSKNKRRFDKFVLILRRNFFKCANFNDNYFFARKS